MASFLKVDQIQSDSGNVALTGNVTTQSTAVVNFGDGQFIKTAAGNIGIGTSSPTARLDVRRADTDGLIAEFHQSTGYGVDIGSSESVAYVSSGYLQALTFKTDAGSGQVERARITSAGLLQFNSGYGSVATSFGCRAWVNFNGTGTVAIRASGNVSSITDNGSGDYTVNFTTAMPDANFVCTLMSGLKNITFGVPIFIGQSGFGTTNSHTTTAVRVGANSPSDTLIDNNQVNVAIFR